MWRKHYLLWTALIALACLAMLELAGRVFISLSTHDGYQTGNRGFRYSSSELTYDPELGWSLPISDRSTRPSHLTPGNLPPKADGSFRLFVIGDSVAYGVKVDPARTFAALVCRGLDRRFPERRHELLNAAVPGYSLPQMAARIERDVLPHQPDLILICADPFDADPQMHAGISERRENGPGVRAAQRLLHHSRLYYLLSLTIVSGRNRLLGMPYRDRGTALEVIEAMLADGRVPHFYVSVPQLLPERNAFFKDQRRWYAVSGLTWVDAYPELEQSLKTEGPDALYLDCVHLTALGHQVVAQQILAYLDGPGQELVRPR